MIISGQLGGVAQQRSRYESSNTSLKVPLSNHASSILVIDTKKVFERPLNYTRTKITAIFATSIFAGILDKIVAIFRCHVCDNELLASSLMVLVVFRVSSPLNASPKPV